MILDLRVEGPGVVAFGEPLDIGKGRDGKERKEKEGKRKERNNKEPRGTHLFFTRLLVKKIFIRDRRKECSFFTLRGYRENENPLVRVAVQFRQIFVSFFLFTCDKKAQVRGKPGTRCHQNLVQV